MKPALRKTFPAIALLFTIALAMANSLAGQSTIMATHTVIIFDLAFNPPSLTINVGDTIQWQNNDPLIYTLWFVNTSDSSTYLLSDPILPTASWSWAFNEPVSLQYFCFDRLWITGFINVVPAGNHDVAVTNVTPKKTVVGNGYVTPINATVANVGDFAEIFNLTAYANKTAIETKTVSLAIGESKIITFTWDTTGFMFKGVYYLNVSATPVPYETNIANNNCISAYTVKVTIPGDITGDFFVNIKDVNLMLIWWQQRVPPAPSNVDINGDNLINIKDVNLILSNWLKDP
ncbi:MAG: hypothetical protein ACQXXH_06495 [Candidatus Bathyarchaeia archaeon]|jgi:plastocyanin|nr:hypothetical protein [Candidatus Bathyarchaeota archaeon A05DMB-4]MDH7595255.1 hypothetical protein [Candidatus Bathyarchaeota archaeon]